MSHKFDQKITLSEFLTTLGCERALPSDPAWRKQFNSLNTQYRHLTREERDNHLLSILRRINSRKRIRRNTQENIRAFEVGWSENLQMCREQGVSREALTPKYVKPYEYIRYSGDYIAPKDPYLFEKLLLLAATLFFEKYFSEAGHLYEFGCGTGRFLYEIADKFPEKKLVGLDWTTSSQEILKLISKVKPNVSGRRFNMLTPDAKMRMPRHSAVFTIGAMEQLGNQHGPFLDYLIGERPLVVLHFEPIEEFYDGDKLFDHVAWSYHKKRRYLSKYYSKLLALQKKGVLTILETRRVGFGDPFNESCSLIAWQPNERKSK
jgi:SAM-dependent methyltransferase